MSTISPTLRKKENIKINVPGNLFHDEVILYNKIRSGDYSGIEQVLQRGVNINYDYPSGDTPLILSVSTNDKDITKLLLDNGAKVNGCDCEKGWSALHYAVVDNRHKDIVEVLLENGADVEMKDSWGRTPLHLTSIYGTLEIMKMLVEYNAQINIPTTMTKKTVLHIATDFNRVDIVQFLLNYDCDLFAKDKDDETSIVCAHRKQYSDIIHLLEVKEMQVKMQIRHQTFSFLINCWGQNN